MSEDEEHVESGEAEVEKERRAYVEAAEAERWVAALSAMLRGLFWRMLELFLTTGHARKVENSTSLIDTLLGLRAQCVAAMQGEDEGNYKLEVVLDSLDAMLAAEGFLRGQWKSMDLADTVSKLIIVGSRLGYVDVVLTMAATGMWDDFMNAKWVAHRVAQGPKNRIAPWVQAFGPVAEEFCRNKTQVSYGMLRKRAREWDQQHTGKKDWILPSDDKNLNNGFKKLVELGLLVIPGK